MNRILRFLILVAAAPVALSGCFLFGGNDEEKKGTETAAMDASGAPPLTTPFKALRRRPGERSI